MGGGAFLRGGRGRSSGKRDRDRGKNIPRRVTRRGHDGVLDAVVRMSPVLEPREQLRLEDLLQVDERRPRQVGLVRHDA